jgi:tetratricopeptide (TPR) repeat protein
MSALLLLAASVAAVANDASPALPDELAHLNELVGQEKALVDAVRAFAKAQTALAESELKQADAHAQAGEKDLAETKHKQAMQRFEVIRKAYEFALHHYPNNARAQNYYGEVLYDRFGEIPGALRAWELAMALDPKLSAPLNNLAIHYCHIGEYERGLQYYDEAIKLDPNNPDYLFNLAQTYLIHFPIVQQYRKWDKQKVYREAMKLSKKAVRLDPKDFELVQDYALNFFAAENFGVKANWKEAAKAWAQARGVARNDNERFNGWLNEARVWIRANQKPTARTCLEEALKIRPENELTKRLLTDLGTEPPSPRGPAKTPGKNFSAR